MYNELYAAWKSEKGKFEIQELPRDFYSRLADYVKKIREESKIIDKKTTRAKLLQHELKNVQKMVIELVQTRYEKAIRKIMNEKAMPEEILMDEEKKLYGEILHLAESYQTFIKDILKGRLLPIEGKEKPKQMLVRFLQSVPAIIGSDMKTYGPYKPEDIATLPTENARILIKQEAAVEVEMK